MSDESNIPRIQNAIAADKATLQQLNVERNEVLRVLYGARFIDSCDRSMIEGKYNAKIANKQHETELLQKRVKELTKDV